MKTTTNPTTRTYPMLTWSMLTTLEAKVDRMKTTPADCILIDHYLSSAGFDGLLREALEEEGVTSFEDITEALKKSFDFDTTPAAITGGILGCIHTLMRRVQAGEKIY